MESLPNLIITFPDGTRGNWALQQEDIRSVTEMLEYMVGPPDAGVLLPGLRIPHVNAMLPDGSGYNWVREEAAIEDITDAVMSSYGNPTSVDNGSDFRLTRY